MKKEIEILVEVFDKIDFVLEKFKKNEFKGIKETKDYYFFDPLRKDLKPDEKGQLKNCLRVRNKNGKNTLTFKKDNFDKNNIWLYSDEYEVEISSDETVSEILITLGFKKLTEIITKKHTFLTDKYEIVVEEVDGLGLFLEVERNEVDDNENILDVKTEIMDFIKSVGIKFSPELTMGKPELMLRKNKIVVD